MNKKGVVLLDTVSRKTSKQNYGTWKSSGFADRLRSRRENLGITQENLALRIGVSKTTIQNYESGQLPKGEYAIALADVLSCTLDWLLGGRGPVRPGEEAAADGQNQPPDPGETVRYEDRIAELERRLREKDDTISVLTVALKSANIQGKLCILTEIAQYPPADPPPAPSPAPPQMKKD